MSGYSYSELEPKQPCPYCGAYCHADFVDIGVGYQQCGPYHCERCGASEIGSELYTNKDQFEPCELDTGWYKPGSPPGPNANVDESGNHIPYYVADTLYRESWEVKPRYTPTGQVINYGD